MHKQLEQFLVIIALAAIAWFAFARPRTMTSISQGGADINGLPWFLSYNVPTIVQGAGLPLPSLSSNVTSQPVACETCSIFGNSNWQGL